MNLETRLDCVLDERFILPAKSVDYQGCTRYDECMESYSPLVLEVPQSV